MLIPIALKAAGCCSVATVERETRNVSQLTLVPVRTISQSDTNGEHVGAVKNRARWMYKLAEIIVKS